ncbi:MAG: hypothetical protein JSU70_16525 [Phycisphaerales bacterium]|nr:MAG: hypothetical protein JSU70_16525 [Phycisphaerales bacterium]
MKQIQVRLFFLFSLLVVGGGCSTNRTNLKDNGQVTIENRHPGKVKILWSDAYEQDGEFVISGVLKRRDHIGTPIPVHVHVLVLTRDKHIAQSLHTSELYVPRNRVGHGTNWKRFALRSTDIPEPSSHVLVTVHTFFAGMAENGRPLWTRDIAKRKPIFTDLKGTQRVAITYNAGLRQYILTSSHLTDNKKATHTAALGVFESPEPWGPWSTVYYDDHWSVEAGKDCRTYHHRFPPKWMSADGKTMWLLYSGLDCDLYSFCVKKAALEVNRVK